MDGGAWEATVHGVTKSRTGLSHFTFTFYFPLSCIVEGNGNPLQCSCLENRRDGRAWWAAVYGVAQSQTRLKRLSSSSSSRPLENSKGKWVGFSHKQTARDREQQRQILILYLIHIKKYLGDIFIWILIREKFSVKKRKAMWKIWAVNI